MVTRYFRFIVLGSASLLLSSVVVWAQSASQQETVRASSAANSVAVELASVAELVDAPMPAGYYYQASDQKGSASVVGSVRDVNGHSVAGAKATLQDVGSRAVRTVDADEMGAFRFDGLAPGTWTLTVSAPGFADWVSPAITTVQGTSTEAKNIFLHFQGMSTTIEVGLTQHEIAEEQLKDEEKQRLLGIVPNFYVSYAANPAPLTAGQKLKLAARVMYDPEIFLGAGFRAGVQQARNTYPSLGQGAKGYAERFGIAYGGRSTAFFLGRAVFPMVFRQDPRYFYQGTGSIKSRFLHAISSPVYCKSDRGHYQPCYSNVFGSIAAAEVVNTFVPADDRNDARDVFTDTLINIAGSAGRALLQEFVYPKLTRGRKRSASRWPGKAGGSSQPAVSPQTTSQQ